jgi:hypothetical protein
MAPPHKRSPASLPGEHGAGKQDHARDQLISKTVNPGQLVDKYGHLHSEAVFRSWSPAAIKALGIRRVEAEGGAA